MKFGGGEERRFCPFGGGGGKGREVRFTVFRNSFLPVPGQVSACLTC